MGEENLCVFKLRIALSLDPIEFLFYFSSSILQIDSLPHVSMNETKTIK